MKIKIVIKENLYPSVNKLAGQIPDILDQEITSEEKNKQLIGLIHQAYEMSGNNGVKELHYSILSRLQRSRDLRLVELYTTTMTYTDYKI